MLSEKMYTIQYIDQLHEKTGNDPSLLERVIYAFGLLEALSRVDLPFCFKGGTALLLLLEHPKRLSTDIDIVVKPGTDIDVFIQRAGEIFPFIDVKENIRKGRKKIKKRHFRFTYQSPRNGKYVTILLDVLFEKNLYTSIVTKPIKNELLLSEGTDLTVTIPNINCILGDKLTAFAPHSTGIPFGIGKELEIIKQLYDCASLFDEMNDFVEVSKTYEKAVQVEMSYRGLSNNTDDVLKDTIKSCLCIAGRGIPDENEYAYYKDGISRIRNHIINGKFSGEIAGACASKVLYLATVLLLKKEEPDKIQDAAQYLKQSPNIAQPKRFTYMRFVDPISYAYLIKSIDMLNKTELIA